ncbi:hypothetical protein PIB30_076489 [Stylosanthes scabra]|uniref:Uncharacterized protein n=1 Tax=Stylosanthes scabra TaxID=79078 RepID=A0ABU6SQN8_9FABA|nr:hypothetical protein [Stylosanthes scabra]
MFETGGGRSGYGGYEGYNRGRRAKRLRDVNESPMKSKRGESKSKISAPPGFSLRVDAEEELREKGQKKNKAATQAKNVALTDNEQSEKDFEDFEYLEVEIKNTWWSGTKEGFLAEDETYTKLYLKDKLTEVPGKSVVDGRSRNRGKGKRAVKKNARHYHYKKRVCYRQYYRRILQRILPKEFQGVLPAKMSGRCRLPVIPLVSFGSKSESLSAKVTGEFTEGKFHR